MKLNVYSLKGVVYQDEVKSVNVKTVAGEITVLDHHRPLVSLLKKGELRVIDTSGQTKIFSIEGGFLEVEPQNVLNILGS